MADRTFKIIPHPNPFESYNEIYKDYMESPLSSMEIRDKYSLSAKDYRDVTRHIREVEGIGARPRRKC